MAVSEGHSKAFNSFGGVIVEEGAVVEDAVVMGDTVIKEALRSNTV